ncbi:MAG: hypothetical protein JO041_14450 [Acidobacteria bacterium]|nr:hypothetical protein [Acidobacteriota bacterium]
MANLSNLRPWQPGQSGNPGGRKRPSVLDETLTSLIQADNRAAAVEIGKALLRKAVAGDYHAAKLIAERTQGKPLEGAAEEFPTRNIPAMIAKLKELQLKLAALNWEGEESPEEGEESPEESEETEGQETGQGSQH